MTFSARCYCGSLFPFGIRQTRTRESASQERRLRRSILSGSLPAGSQLPSVRSLAEELVINPNTVVRAFQELIRDGVVESQHGRGYFVVARRQVFSKEERLRRLREVTLPFISEALVLGFERDQIVQAIDEQIRRHSESRIARGPER